MSKDHLSKEEPHLPSEKDKVAEPNLESIVIETAEIAREEQKLKNIKHTNKTNKNKTKRNKQPPKNVQIAPTKKTNTQVDEIDSNLNGRLLARLASRFSTAVRNNSGRVGAGIVAVGLAVGGWYFNRCVTDKKQHLTEFIEIVGKRRAAQEKEIQSIIAMHGAQIRLVDYLGQTRLTISEIEKQLDQIASLAGIANTDCNTFKELNYKYHASKEILHKGLFKPSPVLPLGASHQCESLSIVSSKSVLPDPQKLLADAKYREDLIASEREADVSFKKMLASKDTILSAERATENDLIREAEIRNQSLIKSFWDCL